MQPNAVERVQARIARAMLRLDPRITGRRIERDGYVLDGQAQIALALARWMGRPLLHELDVAAARREMELSTLVLAPAVPPLADEDDRMLDGPLGAITVRVFRPAGLARRAPALVYLHGGGFVVGSLESYTPLCRAIASAARCVVLSVDYRLAPEHRFPAAANDALAAFRSIARDAETLGLDPTCIAIGGDSAGGNLAAVVALDTREDERRPCLQLLVYPAVDLTMSFPSVDSMGKGFLLEKATMRWFFDHYLASPRAARDPRASPSFTPSVERAPPAYVVTAGFDPLRDEGEAYARRLRDEGVEVQHRCHGALFHGFISTTGSIAAARSAFAEMIFALRASFERAGSSRSTI